MSASNRILEARDLSAGYADAMIVRDIRLNVDKGEFVGIIGPNGAGKSTLIRAISRIIRPRRGTVLYQGRDLWKTPANDVARSLAVVGQDTLIVFEYSVRDIVFMGRIPHIKKFRKESAKDFDVIEKCLALTNTEGIADRFINELSAGERQRVIIAKALAQEPALLILDEPTSHLDISHQIEIFDLLKGLSAHEGLTVLAVLHDLNLASEYCDRLILMSEGTVFADGTPKDVLDYKTIERVYKTVVLVEENPISKKPYVFLVPKERRKKEV